MSTENTVVAAPTLGDIMTAVRRVSGVVTRTPLEHSPWLSAHAGVPVYLKLECWQRARSFKLRGAYNAIAALSPEQRAAGLVTASAGNHGQAVALAGSMLGARTTVYVPVTAPAVKKDRIRGFGATLIDEPPTYDDAERYASNHAHEHGEYLVHAFSDPDVVAGYGTIGVEIADQLPDVEHVVVPVGGGGLSSGIGIALRSLARNACMAAVQSSETRAMYDAFAAGHIVDSPITPTLAEGLAGCTDSTAYTWLRSLIDHIDLVDEASLAGTIRELFNATGIVAEGSAVVGIAAVLARSIELRGPTVIVISGGNIDPDRLASILTT